MGRRAVDFEGITSLEYGWTRWYDHWWVILRLKGSIWPSSLLTVALSMIAGCLYHFFLFRDKPENTLIANPTIFAFYMQTAGIVLAFMTSICYGRYWEGLTALCQMGQSIINMSSLALSFERADDLVIDGLNGIQWKAQVVHTASLLHATCISCLKSDDHIVGRPLDVFGGMTKLELEELARVEDQTALVLFWLQDLLASRLEHGGMSIQNPPVVAQVWTCMVTFSNAFAATRRIAQFPLPLPLHHCLAFSDIFVAFLSPFVIAAFTPNLVVCLLIVFATSLAYHGLFIVNVLALQQPFGSKTCHLPLAMLHRQVIKGLVSLVSQEIAAELIIYFGEDGTSSGPRSSVNVNSTSPTFLAARHDPDFMFPPVDTDYITEVIDKKVPSARASPRISTKSIPILGALPSTHLQAATPNLVQRTGTAVYSPVVNDVTVLHTTKHPALLPKSMATISHTPPTPSATDFSKV